MVSANHGTLDDRRQAARRLPIYASDSRPTVADYTRLRSGPAPHDTSARAPAIRAVTGPSDRAFWPPAPAGRFPSGAQSRPRACAAWPLPGRRSSTRQVARATLPRELPDARITATPVRAGPTKEHFAL